LATQSARWRREAHVDDGKRTLATRSARWRRDTHVGGAIRTLAARYARWRREAHVRHAMRTVPTRCCTPAACVLSGPHSLAGAGKTRVWS